MSKWLDARSVKRREDGLLKILIPACMCNALRVFPIQSGAHTHGITHRRTPNAGGIPRAFLCGHAEQIRDIRIQFIVR